MQKKFEYNYTAPTVAERKEIEGIRRQYLHERREESAMARLRRLDGKVKNAALCVGLTLGVIGTLLFGGGLSAILVSGFWALGIPLAAVGACAIAAALPLQRRTLKKYKRKYGEEILRLSEELLKAAE